MHQDFLHRTLAISQTPVHRLGLSATYRPGKDAIYKALDEGINYFFCFGIDTQMTRVLRDALKRDREKYIVSTGAYNLIWGHPNLRRTLEKRLRQLGTEYIDVFLFLGVTKGKQFTQRDREEMYRFREEGKVRSVGISTHDRAFAGQLATQAALDVLMIRYNAAHRGAERDIFPHVKQGYPHVVGYTATRWTSLLRPPRGWPKGGRTPTAGMCYRFVLSNPQVDVCLAAPRNMQELQENIAAVREGALSQEEMRFMQTFGDAVYATTKFGLKQPVPFEISRRNQQVRT